jgi:hypothetical protein
VKRKLERLPNILKSFATILVSSAIFGVGLLYNLASRGDFDKAFSIFVVVSMVVHAFIGFAILSRKRWGLVVFKCYLYILFLAIPIGTYISYKTLQYMERHNIADIYQ